MIHVVYVARDICHGASHLNQKIWLQFNREYRFLRSKCCRLTVSKRELTT